MGGEAGAGAGVGRRQSSRFSPARTRQGLFRLHTLPSRLWGVWARGHILGATSTGEGRGETGASILVPQPLVLLREWWASQQVSRWEYFYFQFSPVDESSLTLCDPMDSSTPGFPVRHQLPELAQTDVHQVGDAIQPSYPLSSPSPPAFSLSQHQGLSQGVSSLHQVAKVLGFNFSISPSSEYSGFISFRID